MVRLMLLLAAFVLAAAGGFGDEAPQVRSYTPWAGTLESGDSGTAVSMEKVALELRDLGLGSTRAVYLFHNTSDSAVTADCFFPLELDFTSREDPFVNDVLSALGVPAGISLSDEQFPRGSRDVEVGPLRKLFGFAITQDGAEAAVRSCQADFGGRPGSVRLRFGLQLSFAAGARSTVTVAGALPTRSEVAPDPSAPGSPVRSTYTWKYILDSASTWKDPVGQILLSVPVGVEQELTSPWSYVGTSGGQLFYTAESWKPEAWQNLTLTWTRTDADYVRLWREDAQPLDPGDLPAVDSPVTLLGASSFLPERSDVFLPSGTWHNAPFDPARLFDGLPETAWVVRTPRGGIGEYVRFSLDSAICRVEIANGWQRSTVDFPDKDTWSYFAKNNRVKTLDITRDDGSRVARLALADTREIQRFNVSLEPGVYRAVIADIYPGSRWNDTCLGELTFVRGSASGFAELAADPFFAPTVK